MENAHTELGNEVRAAVAKALRRFDGHDIAAVKVSDLIKIDRLINPPVEGFEINTARTDARPYLALEQARIDRLLFGEAVS